MEIDFFKQASKSIDQYFGLEIDRIEEDLLNKARKLRPAGSILNFGEVLHGGSQTWVGLDPETLNTPYSEIAFFLKIINPMRRDLFIDLGAGYGRVGLVLNKLYPEVDFIGYELVLERVNEGNRVFKNLGCNYKLIEKDLSSTDFKLPKANFYFLYDFGKVSHIRNILKELEQLTDQNHHFKIIVRGMGVQSIIDYEFPWMIRESSEFNFSIYSS